MLHDREDREGLGRPVLVRGEIAGEREPDAERPVACVAAAFGIGYDPRGRVESRDSARAVFLVEALGPAFAQLEERAHGLGHIASAGTDLGQGQFLDRVLVEIARRLEAFDEVGTVQDS